MAASVTSRDVQEIVSKLSSDKVKPREEGIKLLSIWLDGERSIAFCNYMAQRTAELNPNDIPHSESWPFLVTLLIQCVSLEVSSSKRRVPKLVYAKMLRVVVQRAEDAKFSGSTLPLLPVVKLLYNHIWDILSNVPSFQSEYGIILRHLLMVRDYRFHMRKRIYSSMILWYMEKVETSLNEKMTSLSNPKEEVFRCILTLHSLLENPPGDFPESLREGLVEGFVAIFSALRDEGKIARKLIECVNIYLLQDGPNLGCLSGRIHESLHPFVFRYWLTSHDRSLKDTFATYARLQLNLERDIASESSLVDQLVDVVCKELDQNSMSTSGTTWNEAVKDDKLGCLSGYLCSLVELAALVFYKSCLHVSKPPVAEKRARREHAAVLLKEALTRGKWLWNATFCCLTCKYYNGMGKDYFISWFEGIYSNLGRIMNDANVERSYDGLFWTLRSLQELSSVLSLSDSVKEISSGWQLIWNVLVHGLPTFSNIMALVDVALMLLGNIIARDLVNTFIVPEDVWDLQLFKRPPSLSILFFISSYFSRKGPQGDLRDMLHLRKSILQAVLGHLKWQESSLYNERMVILLPAAVYALCAGHAPFQYKLKDFSCSSLLDTAEAFDGGFKREDDPKNFDCSVEALARIGSGSGDEAFLVNFSQGVRLPRQLKDPLLRDMEIYIQGALLQDEIKCRPLQDIVFICTLYANLIYGSVLARHKEEVSPFFSKMVSILLELLDCAIGLIEETQNSFHSQGCLGPVSLCNGASSIVSSFRIFVSSPIFTKLRNEEDLDAISYSVIKKSMERLLRAIVGLYEGNICKRSPQSDMDFSAAEMPESAGHIPDDKSRIMDMELDVNADFKDVDYFTVGGKVTSGLSYSMEKWKLGMISLVSCFLTISLEATWNILYDLMQKEENSKVRENILNHICQQPCWSSTKNVPHVVKVIDVMMETKIDLKLDCHHVISAICSFLGASLSWDKNLREEKQSLLSLRVKEFDQNLTQLGELVIKVAEVELLDWSGRVKLVDSICDFILLCPKVGQMLIERLLLLLRDSDYRVRYFVARRIGVLFQTWEGHAEMFQDICSNFGFPLVCCLNGKVIVSAREVLASATQPRQIMETVIITLMHLALHSEILEMEALFMICTISTVDPCQRELVRTVLDNISRELQYACRSKYLEEVIGSIIFNWVACGVSLVALLQIRELFVLDAEPIHFMQYCCQWLLPALILHDQSHSELSWLAQLVGQPLKILVRNHFVPIFAFCIALHCSERVGSEKGGDVLQSSLLQFAEISEFERDELIKKHMVSIVSHILSLASDTAEPAIPFFLRDTTVRAIQTVVDGFLDMGEHRPGAGVIDKINIFRPDRVFMFIVEIHHKITSAVHHRHKRRHLAEMEVLVDILGHRTAVASTLNYLLNLTGQHIGFHALQDQCCRIISSLLDIVENDTSKDITNVLGEQLQFLVSKLVESYSLSTANGEDSRPGKSQVLTVLRHLILRSNSSLHDFIQELEPFPDTDEFGEIRNFHEDLCRGYSPRDHLLKFVKRSCYLPPRLVFWSLQALHKKFLTGESFQRGWDNDTWHEDSEIVEAVWTLVRVCGSDDADVVRTLVSDFISRVGIGDPHCVVFHLPGGSDGIHVGGYVNSETTSEGNFSLKTSISDELLIALLKLLKKYLMDDSVVIVDMTSQVLRGLLSTERGQSALLSFDAYERSLIEVHSRGVNMELVEKCLSELEQKFKAEAMPLEKSSTWETHGKTFEMWICPLVFSMIGHCDDVILRLCQDIVLLKADVSELLLPSLMVDLARRKDLDQNFHQLISGKIQEHIFVQTNSLIKSIQVFLNALNELRLCYVIERATSVSSKRESSKLAKPSSYGSRTRSASTKSVEYNANSLPSVVSASSWKKVYWLCIDYLDVAKSALLCGSYFTSVLYVEHWCEEHFGKLALGSPDFSHQEELRPHVEILISAVTKINEPDSLYGIIQTHKLSSQILTFEHEANWSKALEYYDLQVRSEIMAPVDNDGSRNTTVGHPEKMSFSSCSPTDDVVRLGKPYKGLIRSLQQIGCTHVLDLYCQGLTSRKGQFQYDLEFAELQYEAAWRAGNWDFSLPCGSSASSSSQPIKIDHFNESLHCCLRALCEGDFDEFQGKLKDSKQELVLSVSHASEESTEYIYSTIIKLQILYHLGTAWNLRWTDFPSERWKGNRKVLSEPVIPTIDQMACLNSGWDVVLKRTQLHMNLLEPFVAFRRVLLNILGCRDCMVQHLLQSASTLRKGSRFSQAAAALHDLKYLAVGSMEHSSASYWLGRLEEAKLLRAQGQNEMAISLAKYISQNSTLGETASNVYRLTGKWLAETRSSNSRTILESYLKPAVALAEDQRRTHKKSIERQNQTHFQLAHYADALFKSYEDRLTSSEWQAALRLRKHKTMELEALIKRLKSSTKGDKTDYSVKIQELQKQLVMDRDEAERLQDDRDNFLNLALEGYRRCLVIGDKYDVRVVFRLISLWFSLSSRQNVINSMLSTIEEVQSYKFVPLVYQIASRMGGSKEGHKKNNFQFALVSLLKKMAIDHPYHTIFQLLALANGDRIKDKQRSRSSYIVDMDKKLAAENLLIELSSYHRDIIIQMKQMVEVYIKLAELETRREDTNKRMPLPRDIRSLRELELVPVVTATFPVDRSCQYHKGTFPHFKGLGDSIMVMNGINAPKVVECNGSDGKKYRQLAKSGNDDLRQDAVMEQCFSLVNTFLQNRQDTRKRRLGVRTYKVVPFTPSAGVLEWVNGTVPVGEYLIGSSRNGGAHGRYGKGDWSFLKCREHMSNEKEKRKAFEEVCENFRPVMHHFFLERFSLPSDWFEKRLAYTRSVATSSMVGYIVGLGDRHSMNILIDQATAEVVHIDLGVAFEQGLMLKTPERVPFRLTRDVIDGMGVTGVEGVFRRCCEETLSVMRTNKEALLTIVEVFIHDPLYKWALSPLKALQRQKETDDDLETCFEGSPDESEGNKDATRALMRVKQKLDGYEDGEMRSLNGQVQQLIQDAIDPERLCQMFPGWGAWL